MAYVFLVLGLVLLVLAGDLLVRGAVSLAHHLKIPSFLIALTIVAFGTSAPELVVSIEAVLTGAPTLALGNVIGSNIANILLVIGLPALIMPVICQGDGLGRNLMLMLGTYFLLIIIGFIGHFDWRSGLVLLAAFGFFIGTSLSAARASRRQKTKSAIGAPKSSAAALDAHRSAGDPITAGAGAGPLGKSIFLTFLGLAGIILGADWLVTGAVEIARIFHISEAVIGLTMVALGTSLPELITSFMAALRGHDDVAVGNVVGSNLFNSLAILGSASLFGTIPVSRNFLWVDFGVMLGTALLLILAYHYKKPIGRLFGLGLVGFYGLYIAYLALHMA